MVFNYLLLVYIYVKLLEFCDFMDVLVRLDPRIGIRIAVDTPEHAIAFLPNDRSLGVTVQLVIRELARTDPSLAKIP